MEKEIKDYIKKIETRIYYISQIAIMIILFIGIITAQIWTIAVAITIVSEFILINIALFKIWRKVSDTFLNDFISKRSDT